jgi:hypothetical protein
MQACADPSVRLWKLYFAAVREEGSTARTVVPAILPWDRGLSKLPEPPKEEVWDPRAEGRPPQKKPEEKISDAPFDEGGGLLVERPKITIELKRRQGEKVTRVKLLDSEIGSGDEAFVELARRVAQIHKADARIPAEIHGWAWVPFQEVIDAIDILQQIGITEILFIGAPPPGVKGRPR